MKTKEQKAIEFVENFIKYGFRIDTMPTRMYIRTADTAVQEAQSAEYMWWHQYVSDAEKRLRASARQVLNGD